TEANATAVPAAAPRRRLSWLAGGLALLLTLGLGGTWIALRDGAATQGAGGAAIDPAAWAGLNFGRYKALVIGNDDYRYLARLETATRDAREVADVLQKRYGFEVQLELNVDRQRMLDAISTFAASAEPDDNLLVYYAGHGALFGRDQ